MSGTRVIHEGFMNGSRTILPRVGGGVGVGCGLGVEASLNPSIQPQVVARRAAREWMLR